jgi:hypothetical protein
MNVFLIDADNLNSGAWVDEAFRILEASEGLLPVRRAYGSAENLKGLAEALRVWAVRPFVNLSLTKNTTDIALAVDAMEFACQTPAPNTVVIGSGDADFVPLVVRLRERGIRMVCVSERGKMGREAVSAYDRVILVGQEQALHEAQVAADAGVTVLSAEPVRAIKAPVMPVAAKKVVVKKAVVKKATPAKTPKAVTPVKKVAAKKVAVKATAAKKTTVSKTPTNKAETSAANSAENQAHKVDVETILKAVPALQTGQPQHISAVAKALHDANLLGENATSTKLFKKFPFHFELSPAEKPNTVQYILPPQSS